MEAGWLALPAVAEESSSFAVLNSEDSKPNLALCSLTEGKKPVPE